METAQQTLHIAILPTPGMGHLIPLTEFAKRLALHHNFSVTFIVPTDGSPMKAQKDFLEALPKNINSIFLPPVSFDDLPEDAMIETRIYLSVTRSLPAIRNSLKVLTESNRLSALVVDLFGTETFDVAKELGVAPYIFFPTTAMVLSSIFYLPKLDEKFSCEYRDLAEPVKLPGCAPVHGSELMDPVQDRKNEVYKGFLHHAKRYTLAHGIMVNSFMDLEPGAFEALKEDWSGLPPVYPVGPLIQTGSTSRVDGSECLRWLDMQPQGSVLFVSFGSGGTLSHEQLNELALGLEMSEQRFVWVVRSPHNKAANATYFTAQSIRDPFDFLPKGFLERTKGLGLVVPSWAPQIQVLSHGSTGGFLTHCGWNSILESIVHGVPLIAWPLYAEQKMNAVLLTDDLKVALRIKGNENGVVEGEAIANYVKGLMEGEEGKLIRNRMRDLKDAAAVALSQDGSSTKSLAKNFSQQSMGRQRMELKKIENKARRQTTFTKRRNGLFKKANDICNMCDAEVGVITISEAGNAFTFGRPTADSIVDRYLAKTSSSNASSSNANARLHVGDHRVKELEDKYTEALARLETQKKRGEIMDKVKEAARGKQLWEVPTEDLGLHELEQYKATLEEMKEKLVTRVNNILIKPL
ncbi:hypothetical protein F0562_011607 [Nyssa sinensis]|uniref:MADS-box domain-containing protein n=1 Tax=Nyssa sinensis TaxID=561372 RepID=A0A5J4ZSX1_9ASTE|nr:hypothetical protein F0562_011607 [Nyssa sinensis]